MMSDHRKRQLIYVLADLLSAELVWICFLLFRWLVYEGRVFSVETILIPAFGFYVPLIVYPIGCILVYYLSGFYLRTTGRRKGKDLLTTLISSMIIAFGAFFIIIIDDKVVDYHHYINSLGVLFLLQFLLCYIPRLAIYVYQKKHSFQKDEIIIKPEGDWKEKDLFTRIGEVYPTGKEIIVEARLYDILTGAAQIGELGGKPQIRITDHHMSDHGLCIKRAFDVTVAITTMVVLSPLYILLAILVKTTSEGAIFYEQERIGLHGVPFRIIKFRTMVSNAESETPQLTQDDDPRITRVGRFMRKFRLDELPQMWNILRGDMSLVGPRPERAYFINQIKKQAPYYCLLYKIRPGLTSWGPIKVGYTDTIDKMVQRLNYDIAYMENMSLTLDFKILFFTIGIIFGGKGK